MLGAWKLAHNWKENEMGEKKKPKKKHLKTAEDWDSGRKLLQGEAVL